MNKAVILGAIIAIVIGIIIVSVVSSLEFSNNETIPVEKEVVLEETIPVEEEVVLEETIPVEEEGRDLSVEFTESINLKSP
jgi:hypothetical protein